MDHPPKEKQNLLVRILFFLAGLAVVLTAVALVAYRDKLNLDALKRWYTYRSLSLNDNGQAESFSYSGSADDIFVGLDGDLLVCGQNAISLYSNSGVQYVDQAVHMDSPAADTGGGAAVVYDAGGRELYVFSRRAQVFSLQSDDMLLSARLSDSGILTVVSKQSSFRGVVTVYNSEYEPTVALRLSGAYIMDAQLSADGRTLAVITLGENGGDFSSALSIYDLSALGTEEISYDVSPTASCSLGSSVILEVEQRGTAVWALGDRGFYILDRQAASLGGQSWADRYLKAYSLNGDGFALALLGKYRISSQAELVVVGSDGAVAASLPQNEQVLSIDAAGRYFAVLTADRLDIYSAKDMSLYSTLEGTQNARKVLLREDGSAMLISAGTAWLYIPT